MPCTSDSSSRVSSFKSVRSAGAAQLPVPDTDLHGLVRLGARSVGRKQQFVRDDRQRLRAVRRVLRSSTLPMRSSCDPSLAYVALAAESAHAISFAGRYSTLTPVSCSAPRRAARRGARRGCGTSGGLARRCRDARAASVVAERRGVGRPRSTGALASSRCHVAIHVAAARIASTTMTTVLRTRDRREGGMRRRRRLYAMVVRQVGRIARGP